MRKFNFVELTLLGVLIFTIAFSAFGERIKFEYVTDLSSYSNSSTSNSTYLKLNGTNANQTVNIGSYNFSAGNGTFTGNITNMVNRFSISGTLDGGGSALTSTGVISTVRIPFNGTVAGWEIVSTDNTVGNITMEVWRDTYANFPPTVADEVSGTEDLKIDNSTKGQDISLSSFNTTVSEGDYYMFNVTVIDTLKKVSWSIYGNKTN